MEFTVYYSPDTFMKVSEANAVWMPDYNADPYRIGVIAGGTPIYLTLDGAVASIMNETTNEVVFDRWMKP